MLEMIISTGEIHTYGKFCVGSNLGLKGLLGLYMDY